MKTKHTKGKWFPVQYANFWSIQDGECYEDYNILDAEQVGEIQAEANAILAASAPELLDSLNELLHTIQKVYEKCPEALTKRDSLRWNNAEIVIEKATNKPL